MIQDSNNYENRIEKRTTKKTRVFVAKGVARTKRTRNMNEVGDVVLGCALQAGAGLNVARVQRAALNPR